MLGARVGRTLHDIGRAIERTADGWTYATLDGSLTAHYEHTIVVTNAAPIILTVVAWRVPSRAAPVASLPELPVVIERVPPLLEDFEPAIDVPADRGWRD